MKTKALVVYADNVPMKGVENPSSNQIYKNSRVSIEERELTELHPDEIRVEMIYVGLCGTDVHLTTNNPENGYIACSAPLTIPQDGRIIGHEGIGKVIELGSNVKHLDEGMYVTFESILVCNLCDVCRSGKFNQCRHAVLLGLEKDGLLGTTVDVPAKLAHNVTDYITSDDDLKAAACIEPAGVAYVACENGKINGGDTVVVFGAGPIGLYASILSKTVFGASEIYVVEPVEYRRELAKKWTDKVYDVDDFFKYPPANVDVVIECSGHMENVTKIFRKINANGRIVLLARSGMPLALDAIDHMITNAISIIGSRGHLCGAFKNILNLYKMGRIPLHEVATSVIDGMDELTEILKENHRIINENCKILVSFVNENRTLADQFAKENKET